MGGLLDHEKRRRKCRKFVASGKFWNFLIFYQLEGEHLLKECPELEGGIGLVDEKYEWVSWRKGLYIEIDLKVVDK